MFINSSIIFRHQDVEDCGDAHDEVTKQMWDIVYRLNDETMQILLIMRESARS
jgi:hypothetical protein